MAQVGSVEDFAGFFRAMRANALVETETFARMQENPHQVVLFGSGYGYGFMLEEGTRVGHGGIWDGYQTKMTMDLEPGIDVVVLCSGGSSMQSLIREVYTIVYDVL